MTDDDHDWRAALFEIHPTHLEAVAYQLLDSLSEVDAAVQKASSSQPRRRHPATG